MPTVFDYATTVYYVEYYKSHFLYEVYENIPMFIEFHIKSDLVSKTWNKTIVISKVTSRN